jgi:hypothetical protein
MQEVGRHTGTAILRFAEVESRYDERHTPPYITGSPPLVPEMTWVPSTATTNVHLGLEGLTLFVSLSLYFITLNLCQLLLR